MKPDTVKNIQEAYSAYDRKRAQHWDINNAGNKAILVERSEKIQKLIKTNFTTLTDKRVLDIGCGYGHVLAQFEQWGAHPDNLYGIDLLPDRIETARQTYPDFHLFQGNAEHLDFPDAHFDIVLLFTVFSSILDDGMAQNVAREVHRALKPGGAVLWYDFRYNNPSNPHVRGMTKRHICQIFPNFELHLRTITLLPPLARRLGWLTSMLYPALVSIPVLRTHYLGILVKPK